MAESTDRVIWITGAGSGIGRAAALRAASAGWHVALTGRREDVLASAAAEIRANGGDAEAYPGDMSLGADVASVASRIHDRWGRLDAVVLAAGLNAPKRQWGDQEISRFDDIVQVNLVGSARVIDAALPDLRASGGSVVIVSSYSAWAFNPVAGVAYSASKAGLSALARTLNAQEAESGIRACHLCPGDVNTEFLDHRPQVPDAVARERMLRPADVADAIQFVLDAPAHVRIDELVLSPLSQR